MRRMQRLAARAAATVGGAGNSNGWQRGPQQREAAREKIGDADRGKGSKRWRKRQREAIGGGMTA